MKKERAPKNDDSEKIGKAIDLIHELVEFNEIEGSLWFSAMFYCILHGLKDSGFNEKESEAVIKEAFDYYKEIFNE